VVAIYPVRQPGVFSSSPLPFPKLLKLPAGRVKIKRRELTMEVDKKNDQMEKEVEAMRLKFVELEACRTEYENARKRYEHLLQSAPDAVIIVDREARIVRLNTQFGILFGYSEEELIGNDLHLLMPERFRAGHRSNVARYFDEPSARPMGTNLMIYGLKKGGAEFPLDISLSHLETDVERYVVAAVRDLTERKRAEAERQQLREQLAQAEKISALGRIAANVADEIRNPLTSVGGFARRLQKIADTDKEREYAAFIASEVGRIENLLREILAFSHTRSPLLENHDIQHILDEALSACQERLRQQVVTVSRGYRKAAVVCVDRSLLREAIDSIIANAIEAMPEGGSLSVETRQEIIKGASHIRVLIRDTGKGIPPEKLGRVFEPFFTTKVSPKGSGLGLSIAKRIVEEEGGVIELRSTEGAGTTVTLLFPDAGAE
jgi:PAS domain S-box-containing protein